MKLTVFTFLSLQVAATSDFRPHRIAFDDLIGSEGQSLLAFEEALTKTGLLAVTGIPNFPLDSTLSKLHECAKVSKKTQSFTFDDGTQRLTLATHSAAETIQGMDHRDLTCDSFNTSSETFRAVVATATDVFAEKLAQVFKVDSEEPLLSTAENYEFETLMDVVENGEHLEHFHSYYKKQGPSQETIEMHVDQGLFIAFTPGRVAKEETTKLTGGFYIQEANGNVAQVAFEQQDQLVFMIGDGANQYVNHKIAKKLRAVPHSLIMEVESEPRVWYGRMVLPPSDAVHPVHKITFGNLRDEMIQDSLNEQERGIGCSGSQIARDLSATTCEDDTLRCWHRCMNTTEHQVSPEICASQDLELKCINPRLQISDGESHGDFYPGCIKASDAMEVTPYPNLPQYPREDSCGGFEEFASSSDYEHSVKLEGNATLMWSVVGDELKGRLAFDGLFGWIAMGLANPIGSKNGMAGATIIMALPGGNYSAFSGLDLALENTIEEYVIDLELSAFRHWNTPVTAMETEIIATQRQSPSTPFDVEETPCHTALTFQKTGIYNKKFNLDGWDDLVWAANDQDSFAGYHGRETRGRFQVNWATGESKGRVVSESGVKDPEDSGTDVSKGFAAFISLVLFALFF